MLNVKENKMTQKHVDLLLKALAVPESCSIYLCDRIRFVTGYYDDYPDYVEEEYFSEGDGLVQMIRENIDHEFSFDESFYAREGMARTEWAETILVPLALQLP